MAFNDKAWHIGFKWTIGDPDNNTGAICLDEGSDALHICDINDATTNWAVSTKSHPTVYIHSATTPETDYISMYHDGDYAYLTVDGTTLLTMTTTSLAIAVATTVTGDLTLATEDVSVVQGKYVYFAGQTSGESITSDTANYLEINGTTGVDIAIGDTDVVNVAAALITLVQPVSCSSTLAVIGTSAFTGRATFNGEVLISDADQLMFRNADSYPNGVRIYSNAAGRLQIYAGNTGAESVVIYAGADQSGTIKLMGYLDLLNTDTDGEEEGEIWFDRSEDKVKYYGGAAVQTIPALSLGNVFTNVNSFTNSDAIVCNSSAHLHFNNSAGYPTGTYIYSRGTGKMQIYAGAETSDALQIYAGFSGLGTIALTGYLGLHVTDVDGDGEGELWFDDSEDRIKFYGGGAVQTVADLSHGNVFTNVNSFTNTDAIVCTGAAQLMFRNSSGYPNGVRIYSNATGKLQIYAGSTADDAVQIYAGEDQSGTILCMGFLKLLRTASVGSVEGQIWYDNDTNTIHFWDGAQERTVSSS